LTSVAYAQTEGIWSVVEILELPQQKLPQNQMMEIIHPYVPKWPKMTAAIGVEINHLGSLKEEKLVTYIF